MVFYSLIEKSMIKEVTFEIFRTQESDIRTKWKHDNVEERNNFI